MDLEALVRWAMDGARTVEERYTTELLVERGVQSWKSLHKIIEPVNYEELHERKRQRALNPAYEPRYSEQALRRAAEGWTAPYMKQWQTLGGHDDRPIRDIQVLRFLPHLEEVQLRYCEVNDLSPLTELPAMRKLDLLSRTCSDFRPLARCTALRDLQIEFIKHWPRVEGLADLPNVETLRLKGNLLAFERAVWPKVKVASLVCEPLAARNVRDLPQVPECEFFCVGGIESLEGIETFSRLRNLVVVTATESFEPLAALNELTCLTVKDLEPVDVAPLVHVPKLQFIAFDATDKYRVNTVKPRDLAPLVESPSLRELFVRGTSVLETEAAAIQAGLPSWDDLFLLPEAPPLPPLRMIAAPWNKMQHPPQEHRMPGEPERIDNGLRWCELNWAAHRLRRAITRKLGTSDWGKCKSTYPTNTYPEQFTLPATGRALGVEFHSFGLLDKYPLFIEAIREFLNRCIPNYSVQVWNRLKAPKPEPTPAQIEMEEKFERERDEAESEQRYKDRAEYLQRLHRYELKKQEGSKVDPKEFAPKPEAPLPEPPWERDDEGEDDDDESGDVAVKEKPDPPPSYLDDDHPLADKYSLLAQLTAREFWIPLQQRDVAEYLLQRACDEVIPEDKKE
jgi:hypothetical protein